MSVRECQYSLERDGFVSVDVHTRLQGPPVSSQLAGIRRRALDTDRLLSEAGWFVVRVWEHHGPDDAA